MVSMALPMNCLCHYRHFRHNGIYEAFGPALILQRIMIGKYSMPAIIMLSPVAGRRELSLYSGSTQ